MAHDSVHMTRLRDVSEPGPSGSIDAAELLAMFANEAPLPGYTGLRLSWRELVRWVPELRRLMAAVRALRRLSPEEPLCANLLWYGCADRTGIRAEVSKLVGYGANVSDPVAQSPEAYDLAYDRLYDALRCAGSCGACGVWNDRAWALWRSVWLGMGLADERGGRP